MPTRHPTIAETALQLIRERGPLTLDELAPLVVEAGRTKAKHPRHAVESVITHQAAFLEGADGAWYSTVDQLEGAIFTVRPTDLERREEIVLVRDDLILATSLLAWESWEHPNRAHLHSFRDHFDLPRWDFDFVDVDEDERGVLEPTRSNTAWIGDARTQDLLAFLDDIGVARGHDDEASLRRLLDRTYYMRIIHGPPGWMPELAPGELLGLRVEGGLIRAFGVDRRQVTGPHVEAAAQRIAGIARRVNGTDESWFGPPSMSIETLLVTVAIEAPELLRRPLPPIPDVVRRGGLALDRKFVSDPETREVA